VGNNGVNGVDPSGLDYFEDAYLAKWEDVRAAVKAGQFKSARDHYEQNGRREGRAWTADEAAYLDANPRVRESLASGEAVRKKWFTSAREHYEIYGRGEGRSWMSPWDSYDNTKDIEKYNCAGFSLRNYEYIPSAAITIASIENMGGHERKKDEKLSKGDIIVYVWEYIAHFENPAGTMRSKDGPPDYHVAARIIGKDGKEQKDCYTKDGKRPVVGPVTPSSQRPAMKEDPLTNYKAAKATPSPGGGNWQVVRNIFNERIYIIPQP